METYGNRDNRLSPIRKCWISTKDVTVAGVWGEGTSKELTANWTSPFEGESIGSKVQVGGGVLQVFTGGETMRNTFNSRQTWEGNRPTTFNLEFKLYALEDPDIEVMQAIRAIETMAAPDVGQHALDGLFGAIPDIVCLNIGTRIMYTDMVIESISQPFDKEMDSMGRFVRATLNLQLSTVQMISKDMLNAGYGLQAPSEQ